VAMNFFAQQERARSHTKRMLILFVLAVVCIVGAIDLVIVIAFGAADSRHHGVQFSSTAAPTVIFWTTIGVLAVISLSSLYKISSLRGGGAAVAQQLGAVQVEPSSPDFAHKRLRNVVEEMAIASGVPVPEIYILEDEQAINAFAAGFTPSDAAVTVTRGAMDKLTRDELQGVIAHEFSHVLNGDMRLNIRLMGVLFGILVIGIVGRKLVENTGRSRDSNGIVAFGIAILVIGYIGVFFGRLIKAGISRQREYLADASAVQFTRQSLGIGGALKKIGALEEGSKLNTSDKEEVAHMLFGDGVGYSAMFATHPPLDKRIKAIDPMFNPAEFATIAAAWSQPVSVGDEDSAEVSISGFAPAIRTMPLRAAALAAALPQATTQLKLDATQITQRGTVLTQDDIANASAIRTSIPENLRVATHTPAGAIQVIYALTLDADEQRRNQQLGIIEKYFDAATRAATEQLNGQMSELHPLQRLPLAQLAFPSLRRLPRPQLQTFLIVLNQLPRADGQAAIEDYCLSKLIGVQVVDALNPSKAQPNGSLKLPACAAELADVFTVIAEYGSDNDADAHRAYLLGMNEVLPDTIPPYEERKEWSVALDRALPKLDQLLPVGKELLVRGLTKAISADGVVTVVEAELLRTICAGLHCPLPPQLDQVA
jgi:Zn-dependent protease with chaperone function